MYGLTPLKFVLSVVGHAGYFVTLGLMMGVSVVILLPLMPFPRTRRRVAGGMLRGYLRFFTRVYLPACRACRIEDVCGCPAAPGQQPAIYVSNHRSSIDAILLLGMLPPTSLIIKARHVRKLGYACLVHFFDFVPIAAGALSSLQRSMDTCRRLLAEGQSLLIFPEGMRASSVTLMPFATLAFQLAVEGGTPIIPVVVQSDRPFLNREKGSFFPEKIARFHIQFLDPVSTVPGEDPLLLADRVSRQMAAALADSAPQGAIA